MVKNLRFSVFCVMFIMTGLYGFGQYPDISTHPDTAQYPYWIQMMQDPDVLEQDGRW